MFWLRRIVWFIAVAGWLLAVLAGLILDQSAGRIVASVICAILTWIGIHFVFSWRLGILRQAKRHLNCHPRDADLLEHRIDKRARIDVLRGLQRLGDASDGTYFGASLAYGNLQERIIANPEPERIEWESYQTDVSDWDESPANAVYFLHCDGIPFIAAVVDETQHQYSYRHGAENDDGTPGSRVRLSIVGLNRDDCRKARDYVLRAADQCSVFRGRRILVRPGEHRSDPVRIDFTELSAVDRDRIILPENIFDVIDRAAMRQMTTDGPLQQSGLRTRTALLLHGPPGTGKTLLTKYLVGEHPETTTIMLHGFKRGLVREAFRLARYCQPSIVVIEDVDLIAVRRQRNARGTTALHELLDELDGLAPESRTVVIMTTNRPDVLEPALASRPGRISQAVEVPLPDADCRRSILELFTSRIDTSAVDLSQWVERTQGASPAFLEELVRRAVLFASEDDQGHRPVGERSPAVAITDDHLSSAIHEILSSGGSLTRRLLGYTEE